MTRSGHTCEISGLPIHIGAPIPYPIPTHPVLSCPPSAAGWQVGGDGTSQPSSQSSIAQVPRIRNPSVHPNFSRSIPAYSYSYSYSCLDSCSYFLLSHLCLSQLQDSRSSYVPPPSPLHPLLRLSLIGLCVITTQVPAWHIVVGSRQKAPTCPYRQRACFSSSPKQKQGASLLKAETCLFPPRLAPRCHSHSACPLASQVSLPPDKVVSSPKGNKTGRSSSTLGCRLATHPSSHQGRHWVPVISRSKLLPYRALAPSVPLPSSHPSSTPHRNPIQLHHLLRTALRHSPQPVCTETRRTIPRLP
ncbi:hypothetical protein EDB81DRAFT_165512 [Dactylonectria macrodidyma]|uniref:Uncharacterized protein n=1 Tax=Dactylonectria macrodidyma TaxID=307937 RepID=A0A9P9JP63_9HYPO|nr:hypothetical protein EDB81DRAFT_165512 [Dactylonectria macrodidyma]